MQKDKVQSDGIAEDLIRAFIQFGCAEEHYKTLVEKFNAQLENGLVENLDATAEKLNDTIDELNKVTEIRRGIMRYLFSMYEGDNDFHCICKHMGVGTYNLFECYQASDDDPELYNLYIEGNKRFIKAMTRYLGVEISECSACFHDLLKGEHANG